VDINQLEVLVAVARERSFSRAAEVLGRTQPAVSQAIRRLELEIGEKLFDRSSKDGTLTAAGEVLIDHAHHILNLRNSAERALRDLRELQEGKVTISANEHTVFYLLPLIAEFRKEHPKIKVEVRRGVASRIPREVTSRDVELGVVSFTPDEPSIKAVTVMTDSLVVIVAPDHPLAKKETISISALGDEILIAHNAQSPYRAKVIEAFERYRTRMNIAIELPSLEAIKKIVQGGAGVALVPRLTAEDEIRNGTLAAVRIKELKLERKLNIIYRRNSALSHAANAFVETARKMRPKPL
jgi:DNA-binding transcriptional LysR family regulator